MTRVAGSRPSQTRTSSHGVTKLVRNAIQARWSTHTWRMQRLTCCVVRHACMFDVTESLDTSQRRMTMRFYRWTVVILLLSLVLAVSPAAAEIIPVDPTQLSAPLLKPAEIAAP